MYKYRNLYFVFFWGGRLIQIHFGTTYERQTTSVQTFSYKQAFSLPLEFTQQHMAVHGYSRHSEFTLNQGHWSLMSRGYLPQGWPRLFSWIFWIDNNVKRKNKNEYEIQRLFVHNRLGVRLS